MTNISFNNFNLTDKIKKGSQESSNANETKVSAEGSDVSFAQSAANSSAKQYSLFQNKSASQLFISNSALNKFNMANTTLDNLNGSFNSVTNMIDGLQTQLDGLDNGLFQSDSVLAGLKSNLNNGNTKLNERNEAKNALMADKVKHYGEVSTYDNRISGIDSQLSAMDAQMSQVGSSRTVQKQVLDNNGKPLMDKSGNPVFESVTIEANKGMLNTLKNQRNNLLKEKRSLEKEKARCLSRNSYDFDSKIAKLNTSIDSITANNNNLFDKMNGTLSKKYNLSLEKLLTEAKIGSNVASKALLESQIETTSNNKDLRYAEYEKEIEKYENLNVTTNTHFNEKNKDQDKVSSIQSEFLGAMGFFDELEGEKGKKKESLMFA